MATAEKVPARKSRVRALSLVLAACVISDWFDDYGLIPGSSHRKAYSFQWEINRAWDQPPRGTLISTEDAREIERESWNRFKARYGYWWWPRNLDRDTVENIDRILELRSRKGR